MRKGGADSAGGIALSPPQRALAWMLRKPEAARPHPDYDAPNRHAHRAAKNRRIHEKN
jgi:hypothetical protein